MGDQSNIQERVESFWNDLSTENCEVCQEETESETQIQNRLNRQKDINRQIQQRRLKYFGHIARMNTQRYPYVAWA